MALIVPPPDAAQERWTVLSSAAIPQRPPAGPPQVQEPARRPRGVTMEPSVEESFNSAQISVSCIYMPAIDRSLAFLRLRRWKRHACHSTPEAGELAPACEK